MQRTEKQDIYTRITNQIVSHLRTYTIYISQGSLQVVSPKYLSTVIFNNGVLTVGQDTPTVTVSNAVAVYGGMTTYTVDVANNNQDIPTGTVNFVIENELVCTATLTQSGGGATGNCNAPTHDISQVGTYEIDATYNGDANNTQASGTGQLTIEQGPTLTSFSTCPATATAGQPASYTVQVTAQNGQGAMATPTGTVILTDHPPSGSATAHVQTLAPLSGGSVWTAQAIYSITLTGAGQHYANDAYQGDVNYLTSSTTANCNTSVH